MAHHFRTHPRGKRYFDDAALGPPAPRATICPEPRQENDEYVCGRCAMRWDTHEDKPACPRS